MIMIIGAEREHHARHIFETLKARGSRCFYLDTLAFPEALKLSLTPDNALHFGFLQTPEGEVISLESVTSVYWRYRFGTVVPSDVPPELSHMAFREIDSTLGSLFRNMPQARWINSVDAVERHRFKAHQLQLMAQAGLRIPKTMVTNDPEAVQRFYDGLSGKVIYKPVSGGAHTQKLQAEDLTPERLNELRKSPVQFQEYIPGVDIRVYVIGDDVFAAEIQAETLDFRDDPAAPIVPVKLPDRIANDCRTVARLMEYAFTGIDLRRTPEGAFVFIEANPSPMFMHFENISGYPLSERLIALLEARNT